MANLINSTTTKSNTGYKGIYFRTSTNKYEAQLTVCSSKTKQDYCKVHIGIYDTLRQAIKGREQYIKSLA